MRRPVLAVWYTSDLHFGHDSIIDYCARPFRSAREMGAAMLANLQIVAPGDDLWIVGDFGFGPTASEPGYLEDIFAAIPGRKHLVLGNHDGARVQALPWESIHNLADIREGKQRLTLCHYPMITWFKARYGALQLFGHTHKGWAGSRNAVNVGVDWWNFKPVQLPQIVARAKTLPVNPYWSECEHGATLS